MRTLRARAAVALTCICVLLLAACGEETTPGDGPTPPPSPSTSVEPAPPPSLEPTPGPSTDAPSPPSGELPPEVDGAMADLAEHLGVAVTAVTVVSYEDVTWPDGALGCPEPGMSYTQALVPGTRLVLEADGVEYAYHGGRDAELVRCDNPRPPVPELPVEDS